MKITALKNSIKNIFYLYRNEGKYLGVMVWGAPGVGKSAAIRQVAEELGIGLIDLRLSLLNPVDLRGLPTVDLEEHKAIWLEPEFLPNSQHPKEGILFLDEINLAPQSVMSAGYQLILDRQLGNYRLPDGWLVIAAGNRTDDNAAITRFPAPLANRFVHFEIDNPDIEEWRRWAIKNGIAEEIVAFLSKLPQHLYEKPKNGEKAWKSPRSWEFASNLFKINEKIDGAVGGAVAGEFYGFLSVYKNMPDIEAILKGKEDRIPEAMDVLWALSIAIAYRAEPQHIDNIFNYIRKFPKEFEVLTIISLIDKNDEFKVAINGSKKWGEWIKDNKELLPKRGDIFNKKMMKIHYVKFREAKIYTQLDPIPKTLRPKPYHIVDVSFEIGKEHFIYSFAIFGEDLLEEALPKIKTEVGNYLIHQLFEGWDAMKNLKE